MKEMKYLLTVLCICLSLVCQGQTLKVLKLEKSTSSIEARTTPRYDINGVPGALIKVQFPENRASFESPLGILGDVKYDNGEYFVYVPDGTKRLTVKTSKSLPLTIVFKDYDLPLVESKANYVLQIVFYQEGVSKFKYNCFYIEPKFQIGGLTSVGFSAGVFYRHLNFELTYLMGLNESEEIFWNNTTSADKSSSYSYTYQPTFVGGKIGYAFYLGKPFRVTPQIGVGLVSIKGKEKQSTNGDIDASKGYALNASLSGRIDYLILPWLGVGLSPEYSITLSKSDMQERLSDVSTKVDGFDKGFNIKISAFVTF